MRTSAYSSSKAPHFRRHDERFLIARFLLQDLEFATMAERIE
jgi:hypothetical protein